MNSHNFPCFRIKNALVNNFHTNCASKGQSDDLVLEMVKVPITRSTWAERSYNCWVFTTNTALAKVSTPLPSIRLIVIDFYSNGEIIIERFLVIEYWYRQFSGKV